jgi:hypothetical protein
MERRQILFGIATTCSAASIAALGIVAKRESVSWPLAWASAGAALLGLAIVILIYLLVSADKRSEEERKYATLVEVGMIGHRQSEALRSAMAQFVPETFQSLTEAAEAYGFEAVKALGLNLFGRRSEGLPLEPVGFEEADPTSFAQVFSKRARPADISISRTDMAKVKRYYRDRVLADAKK